MRWFLAKGIDPVAGQGDMRRDERRGIGVRFRHTCQKGVVVMFRGQRIMMGLVSALLLGAALSPALADRLTYEGHKWVRVDLSDPAEWGRFASLTGGTWTTMECHPPSSAAPLDVEVSPAELAQLDQWGFRYDVVVGDLGPLVAENYEQHAASAFFDDYRPLDQVIAQMNTLAATYPGFVSVVDVGNTIENRDIFAMRITSPGGPPNKPIIFYHGGQHAREWINIPVPMYVADWLLRNYGIDSQATRLLDNVEWLIVPCMNPDGYAYTWSSDRMWRKNRRNNGGGSFGVDLNRNWGHGWGGEGSSSDPSSEIYRGPSAFSEPETQAMRDVVLNNSRVRAYLDYHSYSQLVMYPWGYTSARCPDDAEFNDLTGQMSSLIRGVHGMNYVFGPIYSTIYPASGVSVDWVYGANLAQRKIMALTIELRDTGNYGFLLPKEQIIPTCEENLPAALLHADWISRALRVAILNVPDNVPPGQGVNIDASVEELGDTFSGDISLYYRFGGSGNFTRTGMAPSGGNYRGTIPGGSCGQSVQLYVTATSDGGIEVSDPLDAPGSTYSYSVVNETIAFEDNFQTDKLWTVQNENLSDGAWQRGVPAGDGSRGDPTSDGDGSGMCYLTANRSGNSDVDGGPTHLISPTLDLSDGRDYSIGYDRWFTNDDRDVDRLTVAVSNNNGTSWTTVESLGHFGGWVSHSFRVADFVAPTATVKVRFSAVDNPNDSVTESGIDGFKVNATDCGGGGGIPCTDIVKLTGKCRDNGAIISKVVLVNESHSGETVVISIDGVPNDVTISGRRAKLSRCCYSGTHTVSLDDPAGCVNPRQVGCP